MPSPSVKSIAQQCQELANKFDTKYSSKTEFSEKEYFKLLDEAQKLQNLQKAYQDASGKNYGSAQDDKMQVSVVEVLTKTKKIIETLISKHFATTGHERLSERVTELEHSIEQIKERHETAKQHAKEIREIEQKHVDFLKLIAEKRPDVRAQVQLEKDPALIKKYNELTKQYAALKKTVNLREDEKFAKNFSALVSELNHRAEKRFNEGREQLETIIVANSSVEIIDFASLETIKSADPDYDKLLVMYKNSSTMLNEHKENVNKAKEENKIQPLFYTAAKKFAAAEQHNTLSKLRDATLREKIAYFFHSFIPSLFDRTSQTEYTATKSAAVTFFKAAKVPVDTQSPIIKPSQGPTKK